MKDTFITVAVYQYSSEAQIIKGRLEAEGVPVFMTDHYTIDTDPLVSNAIGGVKLKIYAEDEEKAKDILKSINEFSLDDEGEPIHCPECNSTKIDLFTRVKGIKSLLSFCFSLLVYVLPISQKHEYHCRHCNNNFRIKSFGRVAKAQD